MLISEEKIVKKQVNEKINIKQNFHIMEIDESYAWHSIIRKIAARPLLRSCG